MRYIYDIEQYPNYHCSVFKDIKTKEIKTFEIHTDTTKEELKKYLSFLKNDLKVGIGFNNLSYDYPMLHSLIKNCKPDMNPDLINKNLKIKNDKIIKKREEFNYYGESTYFKNIDLLKIHHFDNNAKRQSLKGIQFELGSKIVMETPIPFDKHVSKKDREIIKEYCIHDVESSYELFLVTKPKLRLRDTLNKKYNLNLTNKPDSSIGAAIFLSIYCKRTGKDPHKIKKLRSEYERIKFKNIIFDYIKFETPEFNAFLEVIKNGEVRTANDKFEFEKNINGITYSIGKGGIHASRRGSFETNDEYIIIDADAEAFYPKTAILNKVYINHLGSTFVNILDEEIVQARSRNKKLAKDSSLSQEARDEAASISDGLKLASNAIYGKSGEETSFLYDLKYMYTTTLNGQLMLLMLIEQLTLKLKHPFKVIQANTDGFTTLINKKDQDIYYQLCKEWEQLTKHTLEYVIYNKMFLRDVNNYLAVDQEGKVKEKGAYEVLKKIGSEIVYYKNSSFRIVQMAVKDYFVNNTPLEDYVKNCDEIVHFLGRQKFDRGFKGYIERYENKSVFEDLIQEPCEKVTRYYISKEGGQFTKYKYSPNKKGIMTERKNKIHVGYKVKLAQIIPDEKPNDINYDFYIDEAIKLIDPIITGETNI